jgi:hypothetical protein
MQGKVIGWPRSTILHEKGRGGRGPNAKGWHRDSRQCIAFISIPPPNPRPNLSNYN